LKVNAFAPGFGGDHDLRAPAEEIHHPIFLTPVQPAAVGECA
jgi:hypothetical protein